MVQREQRAMEKGGEKAGVGRFQQAGLEENKSLHMKTTTSTPTGLYSFQPFSFFLTHVIVCIANRNCCIILTLCLWVVDILSI